MTNLEPSLNKPAAPNNKLFLFFPVLGAAGFADATYLTVKHFLGTPLPCSIIKGCEQVTTSQFATIYGIPVALLGSLYYLTILVLAVIYFDSRKPVALTLLACLTPLGFLASLWFVYLQIFIIGAICLYCMVSATTSTLLFIFGITHLIKTRKKPTNSLEKTPE